MLHLWNKMQPPRPTKAEDGTPLSYRTHLNNETNKYQVFHPYLMTTQAYLYWWARNEYVREVSMAGLRDYLFHHERVAHIKKHMIGKTMIQCSIYDPRALLGATNERLTALMCYRFHHPDDMIYGLEWMLSMWIGYVGLDEDEWPNVDMVSANLEELAALKDLDDIYGMFIHPMTHDGGCKRLPLIKWPSLWAARDMKREYVNIQRYSERPSRPKSA